MQLHPRITRTTVDFVRSFEGYRRTAARLPGGGWTVGHGHTLTAREGAQVSPQDAHALLSYDLSQTAMAIEPLIFAPLDPAGFDALVSLAFSIGAAAFSKSEVLQRLNAGAPLQAAAGFDLWRSAELDGRVQVIDALVRRRAAEKAMFLAPLAGYPAAPSSVLRARTDGDASTRVQDGFAAPRPASATRAYAPMEGEDARALALDAEPSPAPTSTARSSTLYALTARLDSTIGDRAPPVSAEPPPPQPQPPFHEPEPPPVDAARHPPLGAALWTPEPMADSPGPPPPRLLKASRRLRPRLSDTAVYAAIALLGMGLLFVSVVSALDRPKLGFFLLGAIGILAMAPLAFQALSGPPRRKLPMTGGA